MNHFNTLSFYIFIIAVFSVTMGCSKPKAVASKKTGSSAAESDGNSFSSPGNSVVEPFDSDNVNDWNSKTFSVDYATLSGLIKENYDDLLDSFVRRKDCQQVGSNTDSRPGKEQYNCGELPFGDIIDSKKKIVLSIDIERTIGESEGFDYDIEGKSVDYFLERNQYEGAVTIPHLDSSADKTVATSKNFGDDLFLRITPDGSQATVDACLIIPGMKTYSDPIELKGKMKKKILITSLRADVSIALNLGYMEFDSANVCASFELSFDPYGLPEFDLIKIDELKYKNLRHEGHSINVTANATGLLSFIQSITKVFGYNIEDEIETKIRVEVERKTNATMNIRKEDIRSGKWAAEFINVAFAQSFIKEYSTMIQQSLKDIGLGKVKVKDSLRAVCFAAVSGTAMSNSVKDSLVNICKLAPELKIDLFHVDQQSAQKGCYSYFFNPLENENQDGSNKWWNEDCLLSTHIELEINEMLKPSIDCVVDAINKKVWPVDHCAEPIKDLIENYKNGNLAEVMEQTEVIDFDFNDINLDRINELLEQHFSQKLN